jgi:hypothetical protein
MILLFEFNGVWAAPAQVSGLTQSSYKSQYGQTTYSIDYEYPSSVSVGSNLTVQVTEHVVNMSGLEDYLSNYRLVVSVSVDAYHVLQGSVTGSIAGPRLYPGSRWGPIEIEIPVTEANTGLTRGMSINASVGFSIQDQAWYANPVGTYLPELSQAAGGQVRIIDPTPDQVAQASPNYLAYLLLGVGAVIVVVMLGLRRGTNPLRER